MNSRISLIDGAAGEIRTPEVRHHRISNPAQWPGYATVAVCSATEELQMNMTVVRGVIEHHQIDAQRGPKKPNHSPGMNEMRTKERNIQLR